MDRISTDDVVRKRRKPVDPSKRRKKKSVSGGYYKAPVRSTRSPEFMREEPKKPEKDSKGIIGGAKGLFATLIDLIKKKQQPFDRPLLIIVMILLLIGLTMMYSASYAYAYYQFGKSLYFIQKQLVFAIAGVGFMLLISKIEIKNYKGMLTYAVLGVSYLLLIVVLFLPRIQGVRRWINLGFTTFQPSEIAKFAVILWCANYISNHYMQMNVAHYPDEETKRRANRSKTKKMLYELKHNFMYAVLPFGLVFLPMLLLLIAEPHLSCTILVLCIIGTMMYVGGTKKLFFACLTALGIFGVIMVVATDIVPYGQDRIRVWKDPFVDKLGDGWQNIQSLYAISSGGLLGTGLGNSRQKYLYISEPQNDFIFAVVCEELGFIGAMLIILLFVLFVYRGITLSLANPDRFSKLVGIGISSQIGFQALLNVCVVTKIVPNTGISLPFFSYGGTSLMMLLSEIGVLLAISRNSTIKID